MSPTLVRQGLPLLTSLGLALALVLAPARGEGPDARPEKKPAATAADKEKKPAADQAKPKPDAKPAPKLEPKPAAKPGTKPAPKPEPKPETKPEEPKPAPRPEPKPAAKPEKKPESKPGTKSLSFIQDVAPILVENCIACHNPKKSESKYVMTTFGQLAKGGQQGEGITLEPGKPDESFLVEVIRPDGEPHMPYKQPPLPPEKIAVIERWVKEGARYDGAAATEDWTIVMRRSQKVEVPSAYPATVPITALAFAPDGQSVVASGYHEITFWNTKDGALRHRQSGLGERVYQIAYSPDGKWMATASGDPGIFGVAKLWAVQPDGTVKPSRTLAETQDVVFSVAFSPDGKRVAEGGADRAIRVFEVASGEPVVEIEDHADWVFSVAFSPDGKRLASASRDKTSKVFDIEEEESLVTFPGHAQPVFTAAYAPDGKSVVSGGEDNRIRVWGPDNDGKQIRTIGGFGGAVFKLLYTPDGKTIVATGADKVVRLFKADGGTIRALPGHQDWVYALAVSRDGKTVASGSWDGEVRLWNVAEGKLIRAFTAAPGYKPKATAAR